MTCISDSPTRGGEMVMFAMTSPCTKAVENGALLTVGRGDAATMPAVIDNTTRPTAISEHRTARNRVTPLS